MPWESPEWNNSSGAIDWSASAGNGGAGGTSASSGGDFGGFSEGLFSNDLDEAFAAEEPAQQEENDGVLDQLGFGDEQTDESPYTSSGKSSADSFFSGLASSIMGEDKSASIWNGNELDEGLSIDDEYYSNFEAAILAANIALRKDPSNVKAYLLRAKANYGLHRYDLALLDCSRAVYIDHAQRAQRFHAAEAEDYFLPDAGFAVAAVKLFGYKAVVRGIFWEIGVEQIKRGAAHGHAPDRRLDVFVSEGHVDMKGISVSVAGGFYGHEDLLRFGERGGPRSVKIYSLREKMSRAQVIKRAILIKINVVMTLFW